MSSVDGRNKTASSGRGRACGGTAAASASTSIARTVEPNNRTSSAIRHQPLEVRPALDDDHPHRIDVPFGRLIAPRNVIAQMHQPTLVLNARRPDSTRPRPPPRSLPRCWPTPPRPQRPALELGIVRSSTSRSSRPGIAASVRSPTSSDNASSESIGGAGRSCPHSTRGYDHPSSETSIRSSGRCPGSPHMNSRSRSSRKRFSVTRTSAPRLPGAIRGGTAGRAPAPACAR